MMWGLSRRSSSLDHKTVTPCFASWHPFSTVPKMLNSPVTRPHLWRKFTCGVWLAARMVGVQLRTMG